MQLQTLTPTYAGVRSVPSVVLPHRCLDSRLLKDISYVEICCSRRDKHCPIMLKGPDRLISQGAAFEGIQ